MNARGLRALRGSTAVAVASAARRAEHSATRSPPRASKRVGRMDVCGVRGLSDGTAKARELVKGAALDDAAIVCSRFRNTSSSDLPSPTSPSSAPPLAPSPGGTGARSSSRLLAVRARFTGVVGGDAAGTCGVVGFRFSPFARATPFPDLVPPWSAGCASCCPAFLAARSYRIFSLGSCTSTNSTLPSSKTAFDHAVLPFRRAALASERVAFSQRPRCGHQSRTGRPPGSAAAGRRALWDRRRPVRPASMAGLGFQGAGWLGLGEGLPPPPPSPPRNCWLPSSWCLVFGAANGLLPTGQEVERAGTPPWQAAPAGRCGRPSPPLRAGPPPPRPAAPPPAGPGPARGSPPPPRGLGRRRRRSPKRPAPTGSSCSGTSWRR